MRGAAGLPAARQPEEDEPEDHDRYQPADAAVAVMVAAEQAAGDDGRDDKGDDDAPYRQEVRARRAAGSEFRIRSEGKRTAAGSPRAAAAGR